MESTFEFEILDRAATTARRAFDLRAAFLTVATEAGATISVRNGLRDKRWDAGVIVRPGRGLGGRVLIDGAPVVLDDYVHDPSITGDYKPIVESEGLRSIACVPVSIEGRIENLLYVATRGPDRVSDRLVHGAQGLADLLATAFARLRDRDALAAQARRALRGGDLDDFSAVAQAAAGCAEPPANPLTARETEVLLLLADGASNASIARRLVISEATAKEHVRNLRLKLGASSRLDAVARAADRGLI